MIMTEEEIKLKLFEVIANNSSNLCDKGRYMTPRNVARHANEVYNDLFETDKN